MKKRLVSIMMVSALALQIAACGVDEAANAEGVVYETITQSDTTQENSTEIQVSEASVEESVTEAGEASETFEDAHEGEEIKIDSYDFEGQYYAGKGNLSITYKGDDSFLIEVWWPNNAAEHSEWTMYATYDPASKTLSYRDAVKHDYTLKDNGEVDTDVTAYTDGTGSIVIVDYNTIKWNDDVDHIADEISLER